ncbi:MAG TPA: ABC transporter permease [Longimicrobiales bacterium]
MSDETPRRKRARRAVAPGVEVEVADELDFHLEAQVRDLVAAGWSLEAARAEALRRFGDVARVERELLDIDRGKERRVRRVELLADLRQDVRFALRQLRKRPGFAAVTVLILGLGIGATAAVFGVVDGALLRPLPFPDEERLVYVRDVQFGEPGYPPSWPEYEDWRREGDQFAAIAAYASNLYTLEEAGDPVSVEAGMVTGDFQRVLGIPPLLGRALSSEDVERDEHVLMLAEGFWRDRFAGDPGVVGRTLVLSGEAYTVVGVMPRAANVLVNRPSLGAWLPLVLPEPLRDRGLHMLTVIARLRDDITLEQARSRTEALAAGLRQSGVTRHGIELGDVREFLVGDSRALLLVLSGAVVFLLLVVCANLSNLFLSRSAARAREFAIRTAIGAGRTRIVRQLLTESLVLGVLGGALGLLLSRLATGAVAAAADRAALLAPSSSADPRVVLFTGAASLAAAVLFGLWPALRATRQDLAGTLKQADAARGGGTRAARRSRRLLVAVELALSVVLLAGAGLMVKSIHTLLREDPGFRAENTLAFEVALAHTRYAEGGAQVRFFQDLLERLRALPGVRGAAAVSHLPLDGSDTNGGFGIIGREYPEGETPYAKKRIATPGYFETMGIPLIRGRTFDERDRPGSRDVVVISQAIAQKYWPGEDPIGREIEFRWGPGERQEIIGVVGDVKHDGLDVAIEGAIYRPLAQFPRPAMTVVLRTTGDPLALARAARAEVLALDPLQAVRDLTTVEAVVRRSVSTRSTLMALLAGFAAIALVLAAVGVYAVTAQSVGQRTREIGLRMALGADRGDVLRMVLREEGGVIAAGLALGLAGAYAATRLLARSLYQVSATDPATFAAVSLLLGAVALLACWLPARRAARVDAVRALRME